ncbi:uncharacterized protein EDB91DRAFT_1245015 [Suillus paluster]|uniref:uncharacterized protein n=1 Tax=Suillus paluster TaxID=48578 RepID=UPI001B8629F0|nr:uncharacterized protein EDB91DRAFT_1245015 [Suillus paluster]KAG1748305.1 hypothetical protein EDB91DRAFT_1245015 [Suillus paluster]
MEAEYSMVDSVDPQRENYSQKEARSGQRDRDTPSLPASTTRCMIMIPELRWKIFRLVHDFSPGHKTFLALALTCKSFTEPALDLLWENLNDGLAPLIRCLPQSLWKKAERKLEFQRAMTFDDWSIFCKYNHRVRSLHTRPYAAIRLDIEIWRTLSCPPFSLPLLPNLMSLTWNETTSETFLYASLFATPKLTTFRITSSTITFGPSEQSVLSCISMLCPSVSHCSFHSFGESSLGDTSTALQSWSHLKSVRTRRISEAAILHLSTLPSLRVLQFKLPLMPISANTQKLLQRPVFCALQELDITCEGSPALLGTFFEKLSIAPKVITCDITRGVDSTPALPALISRLSDTCARSSLEQVQFNIIDLLADHNTSFGAAAFRPLFTFRNLRKLQFNACCNVQLNDTILLQMAKAWPLLEDLYFNAYHNLSHNVTPHAFVSLLQHCPRLVSVAVFINWSTIDGRDIPPAIPYQGFPHNALSTAFFGSPRIRHPTRIAAFISAIAPNVESTAAWDPDFYGEHPDFEKYSTRWKLVQRLIKSFSMVRQQERGTKLNTCTGADEVEVGGDVDGGGEGEEEDSGSEGGYHSDQASSNSGEE